MRHSEQVKPPVDRMRAHYARTALYRMGIPFERGIQIKAVRIAVEGAAMVDLRRDMMDGVGFVAA